MPKQGDPQVTEYLHYPPLKSRQEWPAAIVLGAYQTGVVNARNLQRRGVEVVLVDSDRNQTGFRSRSVKALLCPDPDIAANAWVQWMTELAKSFRVPPVLLCSADIFVTALARSEASLRPYFRFSQGAAVAGDLANKDRQYSLAEEFGMPMPRTMYASDERNIELIAEDGRFPVLVKPLHFREWQKLPSSNPLYFKKTKVVRNASELLTTYRLASVGSPTIVVQEIIQGEDTDKRVYLAHYSGSGERTGFAVFRELRCSPPAFGPATVSESFPDLAAAAVCDQFLRAIQYKGICEIEVKLNSQSGVYQLIEVNPRLSGGGDAANHNGVDLAWLHYLDLLGIRHRPVGQEGRRIRHVALRADGAAAAQYLKVGKISWAQILQSYRSPVRFFDMSISEPLQSLRNFAGAVRDAIHILFAAPDPSVREALTDAGALTTSALDRGR